MNRRSLATSARWAAVASLLAGCQALPGTPNRTGQAAFGLRPDQVLSAPSPTRTGALGLRVVLGGRSAQVLANQVSSVQLEVQDATFDQTVSLTGQQISQASGPQLTFTGLDPGHATVQARAYVFGSQQAGYGYSSATIAAGQVSTASIDLQLDPAQIEASPGPGGLLTSFTLADGPAVAVPPLWEHATFDRPDAAEGYQVHAIYVIPSDGTDDNWDTSGEIANTIAYGEAWFAQQTGGSTIRLDTFDGQADVSFFRSTETGAQLQALGTGILDELASEIAAADTVQLDKSYCLFYDGPYNSTIVPGFTAGGLGTVSPPYAFPYAHFSILFPYDSLTEAPNSDKAFGFVHETLHTMGMVPTCGQAGVTQSGAFSNHVNDDPHDLMYDGGTGTGLAPWVEPYTIDASHSHYFKAYLGGVITGTTLPCPDLASSSFLAPLPTGAQIPPGWPNVF